MRSYIVPVAVGAIAAIVAALVWAYVVFHAQSMPATLSVGIGLAVGLGARVATGDAPVKTVAALAALVGLGCILLGRYAAVRMTMTRFATPEELAGNNSVAGPVTEVTAVLTESFELECTRTPRVTPSRGSGEPRSCAR
jgi:hypothetical protein